MSRRGRLLLTLVVAAATMATGAPVAVSDVADGCAGQALEQPFLPWLDPATYVLAPDGALENGGSGWLLTGDAALVSGNESSFVRGPADTTSLSLLDGSSATTPATCISLFHPTLRFFAANSGSPLGTLKVDVLLHDALGNLRTLPIGVISGGSSWQPTPPLPILAN